MLKALAVFLGLAFFSGQAGLVLANALEMFAAHQARVEIVLNDAY